MSAGNCAGSPIFPILVVTSRDSKIDELMSMNLGADDFIAKPYNLHILEARISAILRRSKNTRSRDDVMEYLWSAEAFMDDNSLSVNISRLRRKPEQLGFPETVETRRGLGYLLP